MCFYYDITVFANTIERSSDLKVFRRVKISIILLGLSRDFRDTCSRNTKQHVSI